jgi:magnesium transporter
MEHSATAPHALVSPPAPAARHVTALALYPEDGSHEEIPPERISDVLAGDKALLWLDITAPEPEDARLLQAEFHLHPLAVDEAFAGHVRPKCLSLPEVYVLIMYAADKPAGGEVHLREVVIFVGKRYLITLHREAFPEIDECVRRWKENRMQGNNTIAAPLYSLLDTIVDGYFPVLDAISESVEELETRLFEGQNGSTHATGLFQLKREMLALRRVSSGQRDAMNIMLRQDMPLMEEGSLVFFQSVYDHLVRIAETIDTYRDLLSSAMDLHLSVISNRMNQVMKTLTVVSTILMSASLIAGIYGMNFKHMPELGMRYGYYGALGAMGVVIVGLLVFFRKQKWI